MAGRHRRPPQPELPPDSDGRLRAIAEQRAVVEDGIAVSDGSGVPYLYRTVYEPDGTVRQTLVRIDTGPL
ncbi:MULTISPECIES: hypothetical protein [Streptomycetaceae]|uniref:hypothetical protein n=1 Tax=Streptomycetaceae TaxID=2062 RepID=UPI00093D0D02|nr:hypothetical protein [Streptomyces sp. CB02056]OKI01599.1 hypothetical protein AMK13_32595 [Streptomyces sp. CB02056]